MFNSPNPAEAIRALKQYTLRNPDGSEYLQGAKGAILISGAAGSMYFEPKLNAQKAFEALGHIGETRKKYWVTKEVADGGLQAKVGAFAVSNYRTFAWCDEHLGIKRTPLSM